MAGGPHAPRQTNPASKARPSTEPLELEDLNGRCMPRISPAQHASVAIHAPKCTMFPTETLANSLQDSRSSFAERCRFCQYLRRGILRNQELLSPSLLSHDVRQTG